VNLPISVRLAYAGGQVTTQRRVKMRRAVGSAVAALVIGAFAAACGGSSTHQPTHAALLEGFGDTVGAKLVKGGGSTPSEVITGMGNSWLLQVCQEKSDAALQGVSAAKAETYFATGYDSTAPADAPAARTVFAKIALGCSSEGVG
jgi:hypothetical protein